MQNPRFVVQSTATVLLWNHLDAGDIRGFVLEKGWKGLSAPAIHGKVGLRASITGEIVMDNVFVPDALRYRIH